MTQSKESVSDNTHPDIDKRLDEITHLFNTIQSDIDALKLGLNKIIDAIPYNDVDAGCCTLLDRTLIVDLSTGKSFNWIICEDMHIAFAQVPTNEKITMCLRFNNKFNHVIHWPNYIDWEQNKIPSQFEGIAEITINCNCGEMQASYEQISI